VGAVKPTPTRADPDRVTGRAALRGGLVVLLSAVLGWTAAGPLSAPAGADARSAREQARAAAADVDALAVRLEQQVAAEEEALRAVGAGVQASVAASAGAQDAAARLTAVRAYQGRTVRALYSSGGELALYATVLGSVSLEDLAARHVMARHVLRVAGDASTAAGRSLEEAHSAVRAADADLAGAAVTAADVTAATLAVEQTLTEAHARLAALDAEAGRLEAAEEARRRWEQAERAAAQRRSAAAAGAARQVSAIGIPTDYEALYQQAAATCPGMRWTMLAAVGQVETRHGAVSAVSSAGAQGPMQFMPRTWAAYGVDADGDGVADPWSPTDAVFSAARYLCANGAGVGTAEADRRALLRYNNAQWYVDLVLGVEADLLRRLA